MNTPRWKTFYRAYHFRNLETRIRFLHDYTFSDKTQWSYITRKSWCGDMLSTNGRIL